jgi:hypothetical protein
LHRYELPKEHPARNAGDPGDWLVLSAGGVLQPAA